jgi:hypothetical protein
MSGYEVWTFHGKKATQSTEEEEQDYSGAGVDWMDKKMLEDIQIEILKDPPTTEVEAFFKLWEVSKESMYERT